MNFSLNFNYNFASCVFVLSIACCIFTVTHSEVVGNARPRLVVSEVTRWEWWCLGDSGYFQHGTSAKTADRSQHHDSGHGR